MRVSLCALADLVDTLILLTFALLFRPSVRTSSKMFQDVQVSRFFTILHDSSRFFTILHDSSRFFTILHDFFMILHDSSRFFTILHAQVSCKQGVKLVDGKSGQSLALPQLLCPGSLLYLGAHGIVRRRSVA